MVPVPLPPSDVKANSVLLCFFPSSSQQLQDLKIQALSTKRETQTAVQVIHPALLLEVKPVESGQLYIFCLKTVRSLREKMLAVCLKEEVLVCMSCTPALHPASSKYQPLAVHPVPWPQPYGLN